MALFPLGILSAAGAGGAGGVGDYELISTTILGSDQVSVVFDVSSFASTYKHLQVRMTARTSLGFTSNNFVRFNGLSTEIYAAHTLRGTGSSVVSDGYGDQNQIFFDGGMPGTNSSANIFDASVLDILDAFSTTKFTTTRALHGVLGANNFVNLCSGVFRSTDAITSVTLTQGSSGSFVAGSRFSIYGIKG